MFNDAGFFCLVVLKIEVWPDNVTYIIANRFVVFLLRFMNPIDKAVQIGLQPIAQFIANQLTF